MKGAAILFIILLWIGAIYYGYITVVKRSMQTETKPDPAQSISLQKEQTLKAKETREQQKRLMEDRQRKLKAHQR
jgi:hypothetical protein